LPFLGAAVRACFSYVLQQALTRELAWQELNASKREREQHEETLVNLEAAVRDLKAEADDSKRKLRLATENQVAAEDERDAAQVFMCVRVRVRVRVRVLHALALLCLMETRIHVHRERRAN
jgi:ribonuclease D